MLARAFNFKITKWLEERSLLFRGIFGLAILTATIVADFFISREISFSTFYLIPVSYFAWFFAIGFVAPQEMLAGRQPQISPHATANSTPHA